MKCKPWCALLITALLIVSPPMFADNNSNVADWVKQTLIKTLSINYSQSDADIAKQNVYYTKNSWDALSEFLGGYVDIIRTQKLALHPVPSQPPTVVSTGKVNLPNLFPDLPYWRVYLPMYIPELHLNIDFSVFVIASPKKPGTYLIQSIDMIKKED